MKFKQREHKKELSAFSHHFHLFEALSEAKKPYIHEIQVSPQTRGASTVTHSFSFSFLFASPVRGYRRTGYPLTSDHNIYCENLKNLNGLKSSIDGKRLRNSVLQ